MRTCEVGFREDPKRLRCDTRYPRGKLAPLHTSGFRSRFRVGEKEHEIRLGGRSHRALDTHLLDPVASLAKPGRVNEPESDSGVCAVERELLANRVASRACDRRDNRAIFAEKRVEEARLACVRRPDDRDGDALLNPMSALKPSLEALELFDHGPEFVSEPGQ